MEVFLIYTSYGPFLSNLPLFSRIETERYSLDMNSPFGLFFYIYIYI